MELIFDFDQRQGLANVRFEGLDGTEDVASMKQALSLLKIRNPVIPFTDAVKSGAYGILRDRETGEVLRMAPNFDNNLALISRGYGHGGTPPVNPMIRFFHELLESQGVAYQYPPLPGEHELRGMIKGAADGLDIDQEYVFQMIVTNYWNLIYTERS